MHRTRVLDEASMQSAESQIPQLASMAGRAAHRRALTSYTASLVMKTPSGQLIERQAGGKVIVLKTLPTDTPVRAGTVFTRPKKSDEPKAGGR